MSSSQDNRSPLQKAFDRAAMEACGLLRKWSDEGSVMTPSKVGLFQRELSAFIASVYFGTCEALKKVGDGEA